MNNNIIIVSSAAALLIFLFLGLYFYPSRKPVVDSCTNKPANKSVSTWMVDKHGKCVANVCIANYIHHSGKHGCYPIKATYTSLTPKELTKSACRSVSGYPRSYKDFDEESNTVSLEECKSKCTLNKNCHGVDYESGNCLYFIAKTGPFIGNPDDAKENETCYKKNI